MVLTYYTHKKYEQTILIWLTISTGLIQAVRIHESCHSYKCFIVLRPINTGDLELILT